MDERAELTIILKTLLPQQLDFVAARMWCATDADAARECGLSPDTVYGWPNKQEINDAVKLAKMDGVMVAHERLRRLVPKAVGVLEDEMEPRKRRRLDAAKEVLSRGGVDVPRRVELTGIDGGPIETKDADSKEHHRAISTLAEAIRTILPREGDGKQGDVDAAE